MMLNERDDEETDDEEIWQSMCETTARSYGCSADRVKAIMEANGFHAYGHTGIAEMYEIVAHALRATGTRQIGNGS
jgi:hypothetical protein